MRGKALLLRRQMARNAGPRPASGGFEVDLPPGFL